jgi:hypothetical protein
MIASMPRARAFASALGLRRAADVPIPGGRPRWKKSKSRSKSRKKIKRKEEKE